MLSTTRRFPMTIEHFEIVVQLLLMDSRFLISCHWNYFQGGEWKERRCWFYSSVLTQYRQFKDEIRLHIFTQLGGGTMIWRFPLLEVLLSNERKQVGFRGLVDAESNGWFNLISIRSSIKGVNEQDCEDFLWSFLFVMGNNPFWCVVPQLHRYMIKLWCSHDDDVDLKFVLLN